MPKSSIKYTERKKIEIEKAIIKLENSSNEVQKIGPDNTNVRTWITRDNSELGKKIHIEGNKYKKYLPYYKNGIKYRIFAYSVGANIDV